MNIDIRDLAPELVGVIEKLKKESYYLNTNINAAKHCIRNYYVMIDTIRKHENEISELKEKNKEVTEKYNDVIKPLMKIKKLLT